MKKRDLWMNFQAMIITVFIGQCKDVHVVETVISRDMIVGEGTGFECLWTAIKNN